ncbi:MAG: ribbon-helix-helix domain-containing protein [Candidatus Hydrothermarchaeaceae archaeon]
MTKNVVQLRMPKALIKSIEELVQRGIYKNKSEVIVDAVRHHVVGAKERSDVSLFLRDDMRGKAERVGYSREELEILWRKVREGEEWKEKFGSTIEEVMHRLRGRR